MNKIALSITLLATFLYAGSSYIGENSSPSSANMINYYNDGVFDTISQINKEIQEGVNKEEIKDIDGKIAVLTPLQNISTVDLIFYKTSAVKINLFNAKTVIDESGTPFMLWDLKQREIDAKFIVEKLSERNIPVVTKTITSGNKYYREPILIRDFIDKVTNNLKNVETKVIVTEKKTYLSEQQPSIQNFEPEKKIYKSNVPLLKEEKSSVPKYNSATFENNTKEISRNLRIGASNSIFYKITKVQKGALLGDFKVSNLRQEETDNFIKYFVSYAEDDAQNEYLLYILQKTQKTIPVVTKKIEKVQEEKKVFLYKCNFQNIKRAISKDGKDVKIDSDNLFYKKIITLEAVKKVGSNYLMINTSGLPDIMLNEKYVNDEKYCEKVN